MKPLTVRTMIFIIAAVLWVAGFYFLFTYVFDSITETRILAAQKKSAEATKIQVDNIVSLANEVFNRYQGFESPQIQQLLDVLPDGPEVPELMLIIPNLASGVGLTLDQFVITEESSASGQAVQISSALLGENEDFLTSITPTGPRVVLGTVKINLSTTGTYEQIKRLLSEIELETRILDVDSINFSAGEKGMVVSLQLKAYYLK